MKMIQNNITHHEITNGKYLKFDFTYNLILQLLRGTHKRNERFSTNNPRMNLFVLFH